METMTSDVLYLNSGWFNNTTTSELTMTGQDFTTYYVPYYTPTYWWPYSVDRKIRLLLSEVEHVRRLCARDKKLRDTMTKLAPIIEVEVDFPGK